MGLRPEDISIEGGALPGTVRVVESLGAFKTLVVDWQGEVIHIVVPAGTEVEVVAEARLVFPEEVTSPGEEMVTVLVTFTPAMGSRSFEVGTALVGAQPGYTYGVREPSVGVIIGGPVRTLDELAIDDLIVEVPVAGLEVGDNEVMPIVRTPRGTSVVRLTPETVRVTVAQPS